MRRALLAIFAVAVLAAGLALANRRMLIVYSFSFAPTPDLLDAADEGPGARWIDDYYTVEPIDRRTFAIGEPRYYQQNYNYLILGSERAVLFDAGPGVRDIRPVVESLTDLPVTFVPSHFHYDHLGGEVSFDRVAVVDLPYLRERAPDDRLALTDPEHLGFAEGWAAPVLAVSEWLEPGSVLSLGDRDLRVVHTPGHTSDSISLVDLTSGLVFAGDFIYPGPLFSFLPTSSMGEYRIGARALAAATPEAARVLAAHRLAPPGYPELGSRDVKDLQRAMESIRSGELSGEGIYPVEYRVNERITMLAEPRWLQRWDD